MAIDTRNQLSVAGKGQQVAAAQNRIRNPELTDGVKSPRGWTWTPDGDGVKWAWESTGAGKPSRVVIRSAAANRRGVFQQRLHCKPNHWYRIEAVIVGSCDAPTERAGAGLWVRPDAGDVDHECLIHLACVTGTTGAERLRAYYRTPAICRAMTIEVGLRNAIGEVAVHSVHVFANIEPDMRSHPLALPPPNYTYPPPVRVRRVCVVDEHGGNRPLAAILAARFGAAHVTCLSARPLNRRPPSCDAVIIADDSLPACVRSLTALHALGSKCLVILSLGAFSRILRDGPGLQTIEQADDPLCGCVWNADFITRGFALRDTFPLATMVGDGTMFRQRQFRKGAALNRLAAKHGYETVLVSMADLDRTSNQPICLYKAIDGGGVIVFDVDAVETTATSCDEPNVAATILLNMLGADRAGMGQYVVPAADDKEWGGVLEEAAVRFPALRLRGRERHEQIIEVGGAGESFGLNLPARPLILIRTGLRGDDMSGVYGALFYLKQLVRAEPFENPCAAELIGSFRLAWIPLCAAWQGRWWDERSAGDRVPVEGEFDHGTIAAVIDVTEHPSNELRVVHARDDRDAVRQMTQLPELARRFGTGSHFGRTVGVGERIDRRDGAAWRDIPMAPTVNVHAGPFDTPLHRAAASAGARLIRIELPGGNGSFICNSVWRTNLAAATIEHMVGLQFGLLAVNRTDSTVVFDGHPPVGCGGAIMVRAGERAGAMLAG
ncbi:MAG: hypothetical protein HOP29_17985 [Phycisphaerales bacterium]|nr:hypothetical protein [Phycisphaerales bacterium]